MAPFPANGETASVSAWGFPVTGKPFRPAVGTYKRLQTFLPNGAAGPSTPPGTPERLLLLHRVLRTSRAAVPRSAAFARASSRLTVISPQSGAIISRSGST